MKKIDLHMHTISTDSDSDFEFSLEQLRTYIDKREIDGIAITNHNLFDLEQYELIRKSIHIVVFPGIEIDLEDGHILIIADLDELVEFDEKCKVLSEKMSDRNEPISVSDLENIFLDLSRYILIPHYQKKPNLKDETIKQLSSYITAGEVASPKKFIYCRKDPNALVPVYFSDFRSCTNISDYPIRQTYIDARELNFNAIKTCLRDKNKVFLAKEDGHSFFDALDNGLRLSTGLNVILGGRSTGKTYTLNQINNSFENVKYIRQFSLLERDEDADENKFNEMISRENSLFSQDYLNEFKGVIDSMANVDLEQNVRLTEKYVSSLLKNAEESDKVDTFSKVVLFNETTFSKNELGNLRSLISSVETLIKNTEYREIIDRFIPIEDLKKLAVELMQTFTKETENNLKKSFVNDLIENNRKALQTHTAATAIVDIDLYRIAIEQKKNEKFMEIAKAIQIEREILRKEIQGFKIVAKQRKFSGAQDLKNQSKQKLKFSDAFQSYNDPYEFLKALRDIDTLEEADYYKYFAKIEYLILNKHDTPVSGGERSEFHLLHEINDAQQFDMLLIDEPESSFDNIFLMEKVNELIKDISKLIPVVIVTHNNTVGASIKPDYIIYTDKTINDGNVQYEVYSGFPSDKQLSTPDGKTIRNFEVMLNCLEAGPEAYDERGSSYEILKD